MNIIKKVTEHFESINTNKTAPCKTYATEDRAEKAVSSMARVAAEHFAIKPDEEEPARYVVVYIESIGRWIGAVDMTELLQRKTTTGGYLFICSENGFLSF